MKEINLSKILVRKRKEKNITQEDLARYIGVSKASVSKWETGQSYPDITFLPQLAAYFNISIDELIGYEPQMCKQDIRKLYHRLRNAFATRPFDEVMEECNQVIKKYYSCFPLLHQMGILLLNHGGFAGSPEKITACLEKSKELFIRVKTESDDVELAKQAIFMEASCAIAMQQPRAALELLLETAKTPQLCPEALVAAAYQMDGQLEQADATLQIGIYQHLITCIELFCSYLWLHENKPELCKKVLSCVLPMLQALQLDQLRPDKLAGVYLIAAQLYAKQGEYEQTIHFLQLYTDLITTKIYPLKLHGNMFFNKLEDWFEQLDLGADALIDEKTLSQSFAAAVTQNPIFTPLAAVPHFQSICEKLTAFFERE